MLWKRTRAISKFAKPHFDGWYFQEMWGFILAGNCYFFLQKSTKGWYCPGPYLDVNELLRQGVNLGATEGRSSEALTDRGQRPCRARQRAPSSPQIIIETSFCQCQCSTKYIYTALCKHTANTEVLWCYIVNIKLGLHKWFCLVRFPHPPWVNLGTWLRLYQTKLIVLMKTLKWKPY